MDTAKPTEAQAKDTGEHSPGARIKKPCRVCHGAKRVKLPVRPPGSQEVEVLDLPCKRCRGTGEHRKLTTDELRNRKPILYQPKKESESSED